MAINRNYHLGKKQDDVRIIDQSSVNKPTKYGNSAASIFNASSTQLVKYKVNSSSFNGRIDDFKQGGVRGDCYYLSSIYSIVHAEGGQDLIMQNINENPDGSYTVKLPGAIKAREFFVNRYGDDNCAITGTYTISKDAVNKAKKFGGKSYAYGDFEVILLELAMEAYRAEVQQLRKDCNLTPKDKFWCYAGLGICGNSIDTLSDGHDFDAIYLLTGKQSDVYRSQTPKDKIKLYKQGEYGYVNNSDSDTSQRKGVSVEELNEIDHYYNKTSDFQKMLDKCKGHEKDYAMIVFVFVAEDGPDGTTKAGGGHALSVTKVTDSYVYVVNPWDTTKTERIPRGDFEKMAKGFSMTKTKQSSAMGILTNALSLTSLPLYLFNNTINKK